MIAVLSSNLSATLNWARLDLKATTIQYSRRYFVANNVEYMIILRKEEAYGMRFDSYIKAPDYESLEDAVRTRVK